MLLIDLINIIYRRNFPFSNKPEACQFLLRTDPDDQYPISNYDISRLTSNSSMVLHYKEKYHQGEFLEENKAEAYRQKFLLSDNEQAEKMNVLVQTLAEYGADPQKVICSTTDFYLAYARAISYSIMCVDSTPNTPVKQQPSLLLNEESHRDEALRIFQDKRINYIVIINQIGMIFTRPEIREAITHYLSKEENTLEVIMNNADIRSMIGQHMVNRSPDHQLHTNDLIQFWEEIAGSAPKGKIYYGTIQPPILHRIIKTAHVDQNGTESNVRLQIRLYSYEVRDKDDNISFIVTEGSKYFEILNNEVEFFRNQRSAEQIKP